MGKSLTIKYGRFTFTAEQIKDASELTETDLLGASIPVPSLSVSVRCGDPSILNYTVNDPIVFLENGMKRGTYYIRDVERVSNDIYEIEAVDALEALANVQHHGGMYIGSNVITVNALCKSICGNIPCIIKGERPTDGTLEGVSEILVRGWLPYQSARDNLAQVLLPTGATAKSDLNGVIRIENFWTGQAWHIPAGEMYQDAKNTNEQLVTSVVVVEHQYSPGTEEIELFNGNASSGDIILFPEPAHSLSWSGTIIESGANYAILGAGSGRLTGKKYIHITRRVTRKVQDAPRPLEKIVEKATLINQYNSNNVADRMADYYRHSIVIEGGAAQDYANAGNVVSVYSPYDGTQVLATIERDETTYSSVNRSGSKFRVGYSPEDVSRFRYSEFHEVLTGSGTYPVPENAISLHAVLIGGGQGGRSSQSGTEGGCDSWWSVQYEYHNDASQPIHSPGRGGMAGTGGESGNVLEVDIDISSQRSFDYESGVGGAGGEYDKKASLNPKYGEYGTDTTFGQYTSADGAPYPNGYVDVDLKVYAGTGTAGVNGADGGVGGSAGTLFIKGETGGNGERTATRIGGYGSDCALVHTANFLDLGRRGYQATIGGAGGGGASADNSGGDAQDPVVFDHDVEGTHFWYGTQVAGKGGDAAPKADEDVYGKGGKGANGGGGGGAAGGLQIVGAAHDSPQKYSILNKGGERGDGTSGGKGGDGCIIVTGVIATPIDSGTSVDADLHFEIDRYGRILAV